MTLPQKKIHDVHHLGIDRTHYLAKLEDPEVTRGKVTDVINSCTQCQSIDPDPGADINIVPVAEPVPRVEARPQRERRPPETWEQYIRWLICANVYTFM